MGEHAISASCTVRTSSGVHHLNYNRWGDSTQRFVPYNGNQMKGRKATLELNRYLRERSLRKQPFSFGPIPRNPSPPGNRRAKGLREGRNPPASGGPDNSASGPTPQAEEEGPQEDQDRIPLNQAISELCGEQVAERPPVPIEANVIVVNRAPAAPESSTPDQDIINVEDNGQEYDSDCQIVEGPPGPSTSEQTKSEPSGLWRLKKQLGKPLQIKLIRNEKELEISDATPPAPPPTPAPGESKGWDSQEEQIKQDSEDPTGPQNISKDENPQESENDKDPLDPANRDDREQGPRSPICE